MIKTLIIKNPHKLLSYSLLGGAVYFFLISFAHVFGLKIPFLFIYFDVPSYIYQDMIIAFLSFGFGMFIYAGFASVKRNELITTKYIIIAGIVAVVGLIHINLFTDFKYFESEFNIKISLLNFWSETVFILVYVLWLSFLYISAKKKDDKFIKTQSTKSTIMQNNTEQKKFTKFR